MTITTPTPPVVNVSCRRVRFKEESEVFPVEVENGKLSKISLVADVSNGAVKKVEMFPG